MKKEIYRSNWFDLEGYNACTVKYSDGTKKTVLQHREVMERHVGHPFDRSVVVHHKNGNKKDNRIRNLEMTSNSKHAHKHPRKTEWVTLTCIQCGTTFKKQAKEERARLKKNRKGPFCNKSCAGAFSGSRPRPRSRKVSIEDIKRALSEGKSMRKVAKEFGVHHSTIVYYKKTGAFC